MSYWRIAAMLYIFTAGGSMFTNTLRGGVWTKWSVGGATSC